MRSWHEVFGGFRISGPDPVTHAAENESSHHAGLHELVRKSHWYGAHFIEATELVRRQGYFQALEIIFELGKLPCPNNWNHCHRSVAEPGKGDLGCGDTRFLFDSDDFAYGSLTSLIY